MSANTPPGDDELAALYNQVLIGFAEESPTTEQPTHKLPSPHPDRDVHREQYSAAYASSAGSMSRTSNPACQSQSQSRSPDRPRRPCTRIHADDGPHGRDNSVPSLAQGAPNAGRCLPSAVAVAVAARTTPPTHPRALAARPTAATPPIVVHAAYTHARARVLLRQGPGRAADKDEP